MGFTAINAQGLTAPPYFVSFLVTIFTTWVADRTQQRGLMVMFLSCVAGIGYILLVAVESVGVRYFGVFLAAAGVFPSIANILPWVTSKPKLRVSPQYLARANTRPDNQGSDARRGTGIALLNVIGQCGPAAVRAGPVHLLGLCVLQCAAGARTTDAACVGEPSLGREVWSVERQCAGGEAAS